MPLNEGHSHLPSALPPLFNQAFQSQRNTCSSSHNTSETSYVSQSIDTEAAMRESVENTPTSQIRKIIQYLRKNKKSGTTEHSIIFLRDVR